MLEATLERLSGLVPPEQVLVLTNRDQESAVRELLPSLPPENIVAEPAKRDTAAAIALGAGWIARRDPEATMLVLPADQLIRNVAGFHETVRRAVEAAGEEEALVTIGIPPTWACPSFGYIEQGRVVAEAGAGSPAVYEVRRFREKPNADVAAEFLEAGNFRWNAGMFVWRLPVIRAELARHAPELAAFAEELASGGAALGPLLEARFPGLPKISVDYAIMERAARVLEVEAAFDWDDVGGWPAAARYWEQDEEGNTAGVTPLLARNNIVYAPKEMRVALVGVSDLIVVQTADALLVCHRSEAEKIKNVVGLLPPELQ